MNFKRLSCPAFRDARNPFDAPAEEQALPIRRGYGRSGLTGDHIFSFDEFQIFSNFARKF
jgi:hypothetical protein